MILFYDIGTIEDLNANDLSDSIKSKDIISNLRVITGYARINNIRIISSIGNKLSDVDSDIAKEKIESTMPENPLTINLSEKNNIELKSILLEHNGDIFIEKINNDIFLNPNLKNIISFYSAKEVVLYGITKHEEIIRTALAFSKMDIKTSIVEDAILPINLVDVKIKNLIEEAVENGVSIINTNSLMEN